MSIQGVAIIAHSPIATALAEAAGDVLGRTVEELCAIDVPPVSGGSQLG